jgi:peptidylprolyl isomerase domain and WD repeat-containing protein 1
VINTVTNKVVRVIGKDESLRFLNLALYQGAPAKKGVTTLAMAASANPLLQDKAARDPHVFCTAYKRQRFYLFARGEMCVTFSNERLRLIMISETKGGERDVFNERPTREDQTTAVAPAEQKAALSTGCTIHTSMGDIVGLSPRLARAPC